MKYIYDLYRSSGISSAMITAIAQSLIGTGAIFGAFMLHRVFMILKEIKRLQNYGMSEEHWNSSVDEVIRHHQIKHPVPLIAATYVVLLLVNYFIIIR